jgi:hypothetical protein
LKLTALAAYSTSLNDKDVIISFLQRLLSNRKRQSNKYSLAEKGVFDSRFFLTAGVNFISFYIDPFNATCLCNAWVNIAVCIHIRNIARAIFIIERDKVELKSCCFFILSHPLKQLHNLNLGKLRLVGEGLVLRNNVVSKKRRWFYNAGAELVPVLFDELIRFKDIYLCNHPQEVNPLVSFCKSARNEEE